MIDLLTGSHRDFANIANQPQVTLVHDDGRAYLTRTDRRFDVIQMSLVDTWASTGAGAFSLSENGLYTRRRLARVPRSAEAGRRAQRVALVRSAQRVGDQPARLARRRRAPRSRHRERPADHLMLAVRDKIATLMVSTAPVHERDDRAKLATVMAAQGLRARRVAVDGRHRAGRSSIASPTARHRPNSGRAIADPLYDYSPPTDARPVLLQHAEAAGAVVAARTCRAEARSAATCARRSCCSCCSASPPCSSALIIVWPLGTPGRPEHAGRRGSR